MLLAPAEVVGKQPMAKQLVLARGLLAKNLGQTILQVVLLVLAVAGAGVAEMFDLVVLAGAGAEVAAETLECGVLPAAELAVEAVVAAETLECGVLPAAELAVEAVAAGRLELAVL